jgi:hypothetical protein
MHGAARGQLTIPILKWGLAEPDYESFSAQPSKRMFMINWNIFAVHYTYKQLL